MVFRKFEYFFLSPPHHLPHKKNIMETSQHVPEQSKELIVILSIASKCFVVVLFSNKRKAKSFVNGWGKKIH